MSRVTILVVLCCGSLLGQLGYDKATYSGEVTSGSILSWNHAIAGPNPVVVCHIAVRSGVNSSVLSWTYNGVPLTKIDSTYNGSYDGAETWYLAAPATGTHAFSVTLANGLSGGFGSAAAHCISLTGADQTSAVLDAHSFTAGGNTTNASQAITTVASNTWIVGFITINSVGGAITAGQNLLFDDLAGTGYRESNGESAGPVAPGAHSMTWTFAFAQQTGAFAVSIRPASGSGGSTAAIRHRVVTQ